MTHIIVMDYKEGEVHVYETDELETQEQIEEFLVETYDSLNDLYYMVTQNDWTYKYKKID